MTGKTTHFDRDDNLIAKVANIPVVNGGGVSGVLMFDFTTLTGNQLVDLDTRYTIQFLDVMGTKHEKTLTRREMNFDMTQKFGYVPGMASGHGD